ncbi:VOC family protein [Kineococcus terrestris]|uniref:VOC family protein n=1 Tax=Kineococcus terrestris TaxID=2044856 RepID=UPI0034DAE724
MDTTAPGLAALTVFVEDLDAVAAFHRDVLQLPQVFADEVSRVFDLGGTLLNVLAVGAAGELVAPAAAAPAGGPAQVLLSLFVEDVDATCAQLRARGATLLNGPVDRPWGKRTAAFADPSGTVWEVAQDLAPRGGPTAGPG